MKIHYLLLLSFLVLELSSKAQEDFPFSYRPESESLISSTEKKSKELGSTDTKSLTEVFEGFEGFLFAPNCWTQIDADGDGNGWFHYDAEGNAYEGSFTAASASWFTTALTPDNYLVSPQLTLGENEELSFYIAAQDPYFPEEKYGVYISTTGNEESDFTAELLVETLGSEVWMEKTIDLSNYSGMDVYIAFRHFDVSDQFVLKLDNVSLPGVYTNCTPVCIEPSNLEASVLGSSSAEIIWDPVGSNYELCYGLSGFDPDTSTLLSLDTSYYVIENLEGTTNYEVYVRNNCIEDSLISGWVSIEFTTENETEGQGFEGLLFPPLCWTSIDSDGDGHGWLHSQVDPYAGIFTAASDSWLPVEGALNPDNYLISPQLEIGDNEQLRFQIAAQDPYFFAENYSVLLSTSGIDVDDFTEELWNETLSSESWSEREIDLSAYSGMNVYIAFRHFNVSGESNLKLDNVVLPGQVVGCLTDIEEYTSDSFTIYPNPSNGDFTIKHSGSPGEFLLEIIDLSGKIIYRTYIHLQSNEESRISSTEMEAGLYLITLRSDQQIITKRIFIE